MHGHSANNRARDIHSQRKQRAGIDIYRQGAELKVQQPEEKRAEDKGRNKTALLVLGTQNRAKHNFLTDGRQRGIYDYQIERVCSVPVALGYEGVVERKAALHRIYPAENNSDKKAAGDERQRRRNNQYDMREFRHCQPQGGSLQAAQSDVDGGGEQENHQLKYHDKEIFVVAAEQGDIEQP